MIDMGGVMHGQNHTGDDLHHQHDPGERAEIPPVIQIARRRIDDQMFMRPAEDRQAIVDPLDDSIAVKRCRHNCRAPLQPILTSVSSRNSYSGTARLSGAGPWRIRPDVS